MKNIKPLKRFGQNYLTDKNIIRKIVDELNPQNNDCVLELGPGKGAITEEILNRINKTYAIEIDRRIIDDLREKFPALTVYEADILKFDFGKLGRKCKSPLRIIGNIPFNITAPIVFKLIENREIIQDAVLMVPHEIAKRFTGAKGTKDYGILSVLLEYYCTTKICFKVSPNVFFPKPKIESAVVHIFFNKPTSGKLNDKIFIQVVKAAFGNRRKTLKNSLSNSIFKIYNYSGAGIDLTKRAEELEIKDFIKLAEFFQKEINAAKQR